MVDDRALVKPLPDRLDLVPAYRSSISTSSISAITRMPTGVAAVCVISTRVPTVR
jgi:hypothetical protein